MTGMGFGWRMATFSTDGEPFARTLGAIEAHLRLFEGRFEAAWVQDHLVPEAAFTRPSWDCVEAWSTLCHWAARFPRLRFGTVVLASSYRPPALLAKMAATTQLLTGGRFILGLGAGWHEPEYRAYGYPYPPARERIAQLAEAVQVIRALWSAAPATFRGTYFQVDEAYCSPPPDPTPPIMIGGVGERLLLRVVARHADWYSMPGLALATIGHKLAVLREHCEAVGRDYDSLVKVGSVSAVAVAPTRAEARRLVEASPFYNPSGGAAIFGEPGDVAEQLRAHAALGLGHLILRFADFPSPAGAELFVERVLPLLA